MTLSRPRACRASRRVRSRTGGWLSFPRADQPQSPAPAGASAAGEASPTGGAEVITGALGGGTGEPAGSAVPAGSAAAAAPAAPPQAQQVFGPAIAAAEHYARLLAGPAVTRGLIGP